MIIHIPLLLILIINSMALGIQNLNATGGSFPVQIYQQSTFFYQVTEPTSQLTYYGPLSTVGKCNIQGYWTSKNAFMVLNNQLVTSPSSMLSIPVGKVASAFQVEENACTDACTPVNGCAYDSCATPRPDSTTRVPLVDLGASDSLLNFYPSTCTPYTRNIASCTTGISGTSSCVKPNDLYYFNDLMIIPAVAGAVVPIYNIPNFPSNISIILSRKTIKNIFMGNVQVSNWSI